MAPHQFVNAMRTRFPQFAEQNQGVFMQQDAEEFLREVLSVVANACSVEDGKNLVDKLFGFSLRSKYRCLESDDEPVEIKKENHRLFICHLGSNTEPVNHLHEGIKLSLKENVEKRTSDAGPLGGRSAQWEKTGAMEEVPPYSELKIKSY